MQWQTTAQFVCVVTRDDVRLAVLCQPVENRWQVLAATTPVVTQTAEDFFENHSHKLVGSYELAVEAMAAAEGYARAWLRDFKATRATACECGEIDALK